MVFPFLVSRALCVCRTHLVPRAQPRGLWETSPGSPRHLCHSARGEGRPERGIPGAEGILASIWCFQTTHFFLSVHEASFLMILAMQASIRTALTMPVPHLSSSFQWCLAKGNEDGKCDSKTPQKHAEGAAAGEDEDRANVH